VRPRALGVHYPFAFLQSSSRRLSNFVVQSVARARAENLAFVEKGAGMNEAVEIIKKPAIVVSEVDYKRLTNLALAARDRFPDVADELHAEMARASIADAAAMPSNVVMMGSVVEFRSGAGVQRRVELVFPVEADIAKGKVSVLTPIGAALIGLSAGQSIRWTARDGRAQELTVISVEQPNS
jgi:regulator of nucleoside diphosphate kinase